MEVEDLVLVDASLDLYYLVSFEEYFEELLVILAEGQVLYSDFTIERQFFFNFLL
jgi:hypothetical protein